MWDSSWEGEEHMWGKKLGGGRRWEGASSHAIHSLDVHLTKLRHYPTSPSGPGRRCNTYRRTSCSGLPHIYICIYHNEIVVIHGAK